jgi:uncharacterized protein YuzE
MRFEYDKEANALYIYLREIEPGGVARTIELEDGVNLDVDGEGRTLGLEFVYADDFHGFIERHGGGLEIPERAEDIKGFSLA